MAEPVVVPEDRTFRKQVVRVSEVADPRGVIEELVFVECTLWGPAVLALDNSQLYDCCFVLPEEDIEAVIWSPPAPVVYGCIGVRACLFERCRFERMGFTGTQATLDMIRQAGQRRP